MRTAERPVITDHEILEFLPDRVDLFAVADAVSATQGAGRRRPTSRIFAVAAALSVVALTLVLFGVLGSDRGLSDRALAAVGSGRVLHLVVRVHPQGTAVDLRTGRRSRLFAILEQWYEPESGLHQRVLRSNGALEPGRLPFSPGVSPQYASVLEGFTQDYRAALRRGDANVARSEVLAGRRVHWLRFEPAGREPPYEVAVDSKTYVPVAIQQVGLSGSRSEILSINTVADVPPSVLPAPSQDKTLFGVERTGQLGLAAASTFMEQPALWLGETHANLRLEWVGGLVYSLGERGEPWAEITNHWRGIELVYGATDQFGFPDRTKPYIRIEQGTQPTGLGGAPPAGTLVSYGRLGVTQKDGVFLVIEASGPDLVSSAAAVLAQIP